MTDRNFYDEAIELITGEMCEAYKEWYPQSKIVETTNSLDFKIIEQLGAICYESSEQTHLILPTDKDYDLITPMEYEHKVVTYSRKTGNFNSQHYGRERDCRAFVIKWQSQRYGFDYGKFLAGKGKLQDVEKRLEQLAADGNFDDKLYDEINQMISFLKGSVRKELGLAEDDDLAPLSLEQAIEESNKGR